MTLKNWWQGLKYWQKGGIIGLILNFAVYYQTWGRIFELIYFKNIFGVKVGSLFCNFYHTIIGQDCGNGYLIVGLFFDFLAYALIGFTIGALIGLIIGKIKKK